MPFYDYKCPECGYTEKDVQHGPDSTIKIHCIMCNTILKKALPVGTTFKGRGLVGKIRK